MQFPGMPQMQFAPSVSLIERLKQFGTAAQPIAKAAGSTMNAPPTAGTPMDISPAATYAGTNTAPGGMPMTGILGLMQGMQPQGILSLLQRMSGNGAAPQIGVPGSAALDSAGMLSGPLAASGIPLNLMPGG